MSLVAIVFDGLLILVSLVVTVFDGLLILVSLVAIVFDRSFNISKFSSNSV